MILDRLITLSLCFPCKMEKCLLKYFWVHPMWYVISPDSIMKTVALKGMLGGTDLVPGSLGCHSLYDLPINSF